MKSGNCMPHKSRFETYPQPDSIHLEYDLIHSCLNVPHGCHVGGGGADVQSFSLDTLLYGRDLTLFRHAFNQLIASSSPWTTLFVSSISNRGREESDDFHSDKRRGCSGLQRHYTN